MTIGNRIKEARKARRMSRSELARLTEIPYPTLAGLENGDQESSTRLHVIAKTLGVRIDWLETGKGAMDAIAPDQHSHLMRFDPEIVRDVARALQEVYAEDLGRQYSLVEEPELFVEMYERVVERGQVDSRSNMVWLGSRIGKAPQGAPTDERSKGVHGEVHAEGKVRSGGSKA